MVALPRLVRLVAVLVAIWVVVGLIGLVLFHWGGAHPPTRATAEPIGLSDAP